MISISTTSNSDAVLKEMASEILTQKLSACTHISKIDSSIYIWENNLVDEPEFKLEIKTIKSYQSNVIDIIKKKHNYKIFELSVYKINSLNQDYINWFNEQLK
tara:strand:- start:472 stop:780 length:309 start_codon:yes stop_codon:yes gene_type:complete